MTDTTKRTFFRASFGGAALLYAWSIGVLWVGPQWSVSGPRYLLLGVGPAFLGVVCTVGALALHIDLREEDATGGGEEWRQKG